MSDYILITCHRLKEDSGGLRFNTRLFSAPTVAEAEILGGQLTAVLLPDRKNFAWLVNIIQPATWASPEQLAEALNQRIFRQREDGALVNLDGTPAEWNEDNAGKWMTKDEAIAEERRYRTV